MSEKNFIEETSARFREERLRLGLNQDEIAAICEVSERTVISWESGAKIPSHAVGLLAPKGFDVAYVATGVRAGREEQARPQVMEPSAEYRAVTPREARILDLLDGLDDSALRDVQAIAEKEKLVQDLRADVDELRKIVGERGR